MAVCLCINVSPGERDRERDTERERETEGERHRERETLTERDIQTDTERDPPTAVRSDECVATPTSLKDLPYGILSLAGCQHS